jgi:hypothetical protein
MSDNNVVCTEIEIRDFEGVIALLTRGFSDGRDRAFWTVAMERLLHHDTPAGYPRFGYVLKSGDKVVGAILTIFARVPSDTSGHVIRCNVSSWYVDEAYRIFGTMLVARALRHREATYINVTPAPHTWPILTAQGYHKYCEGRLLAFPLLSRRRTQARIVDFEPGEGVERLAPGEAELLAAHAQYGCISLVAHAGGEVFPFVFAPRRKFGVVPLLFLIYCRSMDEFVRLSPSLGRHLIRRGYPSIVVDADGPVANLPGFYWGGFPKYSRGPNKPRMGDISYSERAIFGV